MFLYASFIYAADEAGAKLCITAPILPAAFPFKETGSAVFTVTAKNQPEIHKTVTVTSAYVPVTSVVPAISGTKEIHSRNANSDGQGKRMAELHSINPWFGSCHTGKCNQCR